MRKFISFIALFLSIVMYGEVKLPQIISDNMIVQRGEPVRLWGTADPGETINISASRVGKGKKYKGSATVVANEDGKWIAQLPPMPEKGEYKININDITLSGILSGDVYLCSGQSNMELPVARVTDMFADEIAAYENDKIRQFNIPSVFDFHQPQEDVPATQWVPVDADHVMKFSALAYFMAKDLYEKDGVPVGIINSSWGGTPIESWISENSLQPFTFALNQKRLYEDDGYRDRIVKQEAENHARWKAVLWATDPGLQESVKWYDPKYDDSNWEDMDLHRAREWNNDGLNPQNGTHWFRKSLNLSADEAKQSAVLRLGCIVDADSVYVNGAFVGTVSYQYPPRIYQVPAGLLKEGDNNITIRLISQFGSPHFVEEKPYKLIIGDNEHNLEKGWKYHIGTPMPHAPGTEFFCRQPAVLYNAMIHPIINVPVKGVVWYQGESNVERRNEYYGLLLTMMQDWRKAFGNEQMPFYIVELADFLHPSDRGGRAAWAEMRKQQARAAEADENAYLIKNSDLGEWNDIHPLDKKTLGGRVADAIRQR